MKKSRCRSALPRSDTKHPRPSRRTPDPPRRRPGSSAEWCCSRPRRARCRPTAAARPARWRADGRRRADRRRQRRSTRTSQPCCCGQRVDAPLRGFAGCAPAGQHQLPGAVRGQVSGDLQSERAEPAGHQIRCALRKFQRRRVGLPGPANQPGHVDGLIAQCDLVFTAAASCDDLSLSKPDHSSASAAGQVGQAAPYLRNTPARRRGRIPTGGLLRRHRVSVGDALRTTGYHPDRVCAVRRRPRRGTVAGCHRGCGVASAAATASTAPGRCPARRRAGCAAPARRRRSTQLVDEVVPRRRRTPATRGPGAGGRAWSSRRSMAACAAASSPMSSQVDPSPVSARRGVGGPLPADLVADIGDGLHRPLLVVLCGKLVQHIGSRGCVARAVEQRGEFLDPAVLEQSDGFGARSAISRGRLRSPACR